MALAYELPKPQIIGEIPVEQLQAIQTALIADGFDSYRGSSYSPHHPGHALQMREAISHSADRNPRDYTTARPLFEEVTRTMDEQAATCLRGLMAVAQKVRIQTANYKVSAGWENHASNVTYWDREDYYYGPSTKAVISDFDSLEVLAGKIKGKAMPRTWLTRTHEILDLSDEELTAEYGLSIIPVQAGQLAIIPPHSIARRQDKGRPASTYIELGYDKPVGAKSPLSKLGKLVYMPKFNRP